MLAAGQVKAVASHRALICYVTASCAVRLWPTPIIGSAITPVRSCRELVMEMLQRRAATEQPLNSVVGVPSSTAVALQQQQLQQLLCPQQPLSHQQQQQQQQLQEQQPGQSSCHVAAFSQQQQQQQPAVVGSLTGVGSWPWQRPASTASSTALGIPASQFSPQFSSRQPRDMTSLLSLPDQQACPRLDGAYLAACIKPSPAPLSSPTLRHPLQRPMHLLPPNRQILPASCAAASLSFSGAKGVKAESEHSGSAASPTTSLQSILSATSALTAKPEAEQSAGFCPSQAHFDSLGTLKNVHTCSGA